jgi:hypothetical protein
MTSRRAIALAALLALSCAADPPTSKEPDAMEYPFDDSPLGSGSVDPTPPPDRAAAPTGRGLIATQFLQWQHGLNLPQVVLTAEVAPEHAAPCVLQLGAPTLPQNTGSTDPSNQGHAELNGLVYARDNSDGNKAPAEVAVLIDISVGGVRRQILADWKAGAYQLPPFTSLRVSLRSVGNVVSPPNTPPLYYPTLTFQASVSFGQAPQGGDVLTATYWDATDLQFGGNIPVGARALELLTPGTITIGASDVPGVSEGWHQLYTFSRASDGSASPPFSPIRIDNHTHPGATQVNGWLFEREGLGVSIVRWLLSF